MPSKVKTAEKFSRLLSQIYLLETVTGSLCIRISERPKIVSSLRTLAMELALIGYISDERDAIFDSTDRALQSVLDIIEKIEPEIL